MRTSHHAAENLPGLPQSAVRSMAAACPAGKESCHFPRGRTSIPGNISGWMPSDDQSGLRQSACPCKYRKVPPIRKRRLPFAPDRPSACAMAQPFAAKNTSKIRHTDQLSPEIDYFCSLALVLPCCHVCPKNDILAAFLPILPRSFPACKKQFSPSSFPPVPDPCPAERLCFLQPQGRGTSGPYGFAQDESA